MLDFMWSSNVEKIGYSAHKRCHLFLAFRVLLIDLIEAQVGGCRTCRVFDVGGVHLHLVAEECTVWDRSHWWTTVIFLWIATGVADCREHLMVLMVVLNADSNWTANESDLGCRRRRVSSCMSVLLLERSRAIVVDGHYFGLTGLKQMFLGLRRDSGYGLSLCVY